MITVWILGDQLSPEHAALTETDQREARVLMIESKARGSLIRYHQIQLVLVYSARGISRSSSATAAGRLGGKPYVFYDLLRAERQAPRSTATTWWQRVRLQLHNGILIESNEKGSNRASSFSYRSGF